MKKPVQGNRYIKIVKLNSKNQIVIPKAARDAMKLKGRDKLLVAVKDKVTVIMPKPRSYRSTLAYAGQGVYKRAYLKKERISW